MIRLLAKTTALVCLVVIHLSASMAQAATENNGEMLPIGPSIWRGEYSYTDSNRNPVTVVAIKIDPRRYFISVTDVVNTITKSGRIPYPSYSIGELSKITKLFLIINGGFFSSYSLPRPSGLFVSHGRIVQEANRSNIIMNGLFYIDRNTAMPNIVPFKTKKPPLAATEPSVGVKKDPLLVRKEAILAMQQRNKSSKPVFSKNYYMALQSGPLLIFDSERKYTESKKKYYRRSVIALGKDGKNQPRMFFVATQDKTSLKGLVDFLWKAEDKGGLGCTSALNLGGGVISGLIMSAKNNPKLKIGGKYYQIGNTDSANATVIAASVK